MSFQQNRVEETDNANYLNLYERIDARTIANNDLLQYDSSISRWKNVSQASLLGPKGFKYNFTESLLIDGAEDIGFVVEGWTESFDTIGGFDPVTGIWTVPESAYYLLIGRTSFQWDETTGFRMMRLVVDGTTTICMDSRTHTSSTTGDRCMPESQTIEYLVEGTTVSMLAYVTDAGDDTYLVGLDGAGADIVTQFTVWKLQYGN